MFGVPGGPCIIFPPGFDGTRIGQSRGQSFRRTGGFENGGSDFPEIDGSAYCVVVGKYIQFLMNMWEMIQFAEYSLILLGDLSLPSLGTVTYPIVQTHFNSRMIFRTSIGICDCFLDPIFDEYFVG